jgi:hypothetical protein
LTVTKSQATPTDKNRDVKKTTPVGNASSIDTSVVDEYPVASDPSNPNQYKFTPSLCHISLANIQTMT